MKQEIGIATIDYSSDGTATGASFAPSMRVDLDKRALLQLTTIKARDPKIVEDNAGYVFASWFSRMNEIELADRDKFIVVPQTIKCETYPNGKVKHCEIAFNFQEV